MPATITQTIYTAAELQEASPSGFDRAREDFTVSTWQDAWIADEAVTDFTDNVLPAFGLEADGPTDDRRYPIIDYSAGNYNGGDFARPGAHTTIRVVEFAPFVAALRGAAKDMLDYADNLPRVTVDRRRAIWRALEERTADLRIEADESRYGITCRIEVDAWANAWQERTGEEYARLEAQAETLADDVQEWARALFDDLPRHMVAEYEGETSAEGFIEAAEANDWWYFADGRMAPAPVNQEVTQ